VSLLLIIGIVILPVIFVWFLLRQGYSTTTRILGFGWLILFLIIALSGDPEKGAPPPASTTEAVAPAAAMAKAVPVQVDPTTERLGNIKKMAREITSVSEGNNGKELVIDQEEKTTWSETTWVTSITIWNKDFLRKLQKSYPGEYDSVTIGYTVPTRDKYGNSGSDIAMAMTFDMNEVAKINWDGITFSGLTNFAEFAFTPLGRKAVLAWCADGNADKAQKLCSKALE
jgi:hypothetical protein